MSKVEEQVDVKQALDNARVIVGLSKAAWQQLVGDCFDAWRTRQAHLQDCVETLHTWQTAIARAAARGEVCVDSVVCVISNHQWARLIPHTCVLLRQTQKQLLDMDSAYICQELRDAIEKTTLEKELLRQCLCVEQPALMLLELQGVPVDVVRIVAQYVSSHFFQQPSTYNSIFRFA
jgi:hypothetical protein